jgi:glycerol kinase
MADSNALILAIDQGTTNTKVVLVDKRGMIVAEAARPLEQRYPHPAWVEQDPAALWNSVRAAIDDCLASVADPRLVAIALTNQRESATAWERRSGRPLGPVVVWQCRRTADRCAELRARGMEAFLHERTGLAIDPLFSATKMRWLLDHTPDGEQRAAQGDLCLGTVDSWVLWNLTGGAVHGCDMTNASRTQLFDLHALDWGDDLQDLFGIPRAALPAVYPSSGFVGESVALGRLPAGVPIMSLIGDSHAALFGQAGWHAGVVKATYGTGSSLMTPTPEPVLSRHGLSTTIAWALDRERVTYALEGNISVTGAAVQWLGEFLHLPHADDVAALAARVENAGGVYLVPAFVGLGAPHWNDAARGLICGMTRGTTAAHLARATIESIAYQVRDVFDIMQAEAGTDLSVLLADGGASRNTMLMQFQADITGYTVLRNQSPDASALGAAYLSGLAAGVWRTLDEIEALPRSRERFEPHMTTEERTARTTGWKTAVARTMLSTT